MNNIKKEDFSTRLRQIMNERNLSQAELSKITKITASSISDWLNNKYEAKQDKVDIIATALNISQSWLMGYDVPMVKPKNVIDISDTIAKKIPILGTIACGEPIWAYENFDGYFVADTSIKADFIVKAKGDSMIEAGINDGDLVFLKKTPTVDNGRIGAVLIDNEATLKKVIKTDNAVILQPCNSDYQPIVLTSYDEAMILGEMVGVYQTRNK